MVNIITAGGTGWNYATQCRLNTQSSGKRAWRGINCTLMLLYCIIYHRTSTSRLLVRGECVLRGFNSLPPGSMVPNIYCASPAIQTLLPHDIFIQLCFISQIQKKNEFWGSRPSCEYFPPATYMQQAAFDSKQTREGETLGACETFVKCSL